MKYFLAAGGLGNQLFIWNAAHIANLHTNEPVRIVYPKGNKLADRENELEKLQDFCNHDIRIIQSSLLFATLRIRDRIGNYSTRLSKVIDSVLRIHKSTNPEDALDFRDLNKKIFVGYFQNSDQTLKNLKNLYPELLQFEKTIIARHPIIFAAIEKNHMTGIHIRRGDFLYNKKTIGVLALEYFKPINEASNLLIAIERSSDLEPISREFALVSGEDYSPWETFFILGSCKEIWISNSTFSWWVGCLASCRETKVVAPNPWNMTQINSDRYLINPHFLQENSIFEF